MVSFIDENLMISIPLLGVMLVLMVLIVFGDIYESHMLRNQDKQRDNVQVWKAEEGRTIVEEI